MATTLNSAYGGMGYPSSGAKFPPSWLSEVDWNERSLQTDFREVPRWVAFVFPIGKEQSTNQMTEVRPAEWVGGFIPRTELGKRLVALRNKAIATGMRLLNEEEILEEVRRRRGELENDEADLS